MIRTLNGVRLAGLLAATLAAGSLQAAPLNLSGAAVTGAATLNNGPLVLLNGADGSVASGALQVSDADVEFATGDIEDALGFPVSPSWLIDFSTSGQITFFDNTDTNKPNGTYTFSFVFSGLTGAIGEMVDLDLSLLAEGNVTAAFTAPATLQFTLEGVEFADFNGSFSAQLNTAPQAAVPLPGTLALAGLALALMAAPARRRKEV